MERRGGLGFPSRALKAGSTGATGATGRAGASPRRAFHRSTG